jgi:hypothetical protein
LQVECRTVTFALKVLRARGLASKLCNFALRVFAVRAAGRDEKCKISRKQHKGLQQSIATFDGIGAEYSTTQSRGDFGTAVAENLNSSLVGGDMLQA